MPIYDFQCTNEQCKHEYDEYVPYQWSQDSETRPEVEAFLKTLVCPKCGAQVKRIPSVNARMKGNWSQWNVLG